MRFEYPIHDPAKRLIRFPAIHSVELWPKAPSQYVCIFEALNIVGKALSAGAWTGRELQAVSWPDSPKLQRLAARLSRPMSVIPESIVGAYPKRREPPEPIEHVNDWRAEKLNEQWEANAQAVQRLTQSIEWIAQRCRDGDLTSFWRLRTVGTSIMPMGKHEWNVDAPLATFVIEGGNKRYCHEYKNPGPFDVFVFFEKQSLLDVLKREPKAPLVVAETDLATLSPYLRLAIHVALGQRYVAKGSCETKDVREALVTAAWPQFVPDIEPVPAMVQAIAKVMNFPDPEAIERGRRGGTAAKRGNSAKG